jgi:hypothetical protein
MVAAPKPVDLPSIRKETLSVDTPDPSPPSTVNVGWGAATKSSVTDSCLDGSKKESRPAASTTQSTTTTIATTSVWGSKMSGAAIVQKGLQELNDQHDTGVSESRGVGDKKW